MMEGLTDPSSAWRAGVIGWPLGHSISPAFQQPAFDALRLPVRYTALPIEPSALPDFVAGLRSTDSPRWLGVNVTIPHKETVVGMVDEVTEEARLIGAVNTIIHDRGRLRGDNTDAVGFLMGLRDAGVDPVGLRTLIIGAGGASRAVGVALLRAGVTELSIANRSPERAEALAWYLGAAFPHAVVAPLPLDAGVLRIELQTARLVVNTTSMGMARGPASGADPVPSDALASHHIVYDLVYNPAETPLLATARHVGATVVAGLPMLIHQGAASFRRWTGAEPPVDIMFVHGRRALGYSAQ